AIATALKEHHTTSMLKTLDVSENGILDGVRAEISKYVELVEQEFNAFGTKGKELLEADTKVHMDEDWRDDLVYDDRFDDSLTGDVDDWIHHGQVSLKLIDYLTRFFADKGWVGRSAYLVDLMKSMVLASDWATDGVLLVPSLLGPAPTEFAAEAAERVGNNALVCWMQFAFLPKGVFQRFVCTFGKHFPKADDTKIVEVFADQALLVYNTVAVWVVADDVAGKLIFRVAREGVDLAGEIAATLTEMLVVIDGQFMHNGLKGELVLSASSEDDPGSSARYELFSKARDKGREKVETLRSGVYINMSALSAFTGVNQAVKGEAKEYDVFLSHNWGVNDVTHRRVLDIAAGLRNVGLRVWVDEERMQGDVTVRMAEGIRASKVVVIFVTALYADKIGSEDVNDNCRFEFNFARKHRGTALIPAILDSSMLDTSRWTGPIARLFDLLYVDLTADPPVPAKVQELVEQIRERAN
ncbi:Nucleotide-binding oligomerization domain-containing protein 2, partial [Durusdinium trenchii]